MIKNNYVIDKSGYSTKYYSYLKSNARSSENLNFEVQVAGQDKAGILAYSVWLNDSVWVGLFKTCIRLYENKKLLSQWPVTKDVSALVVRNGIIYVLNSDASSYCIDPDDKTIINITVKSNALVEGKPVLFYDKLNDQPLLLSNGNLYEVSFKESMISANLIATLKNLPADITSVVMHPNKRFVFVSTNTTGVYIYRRSPFRVYKFSTNDESNPGNDLNNNYATVLVDSNHIFTSRSLLFDLTTGQFRKLPVTITLPMNIGLDSSKNIWSATARDIASFHLGKPGKINRYPLGKRNYLNTFFYRGVESFGYQRLNF